MQIKLLVFGANYCGSCNFLKKEVLPLLPEEISWRYIDGMNEPMLARTWNISKIPCIIYLNECGHVLHRHEGFMSLNEILARTEKIKSEHLGL